MKKARALPAALGIAMCAGLAPLAAAGDIDLLTTLELEYRAFTSDSANPNHFNSSYAGSIELEIDGRFDSGNTYYRFTPFGRWDSEDEQREHGDIRELYLIHVDQHWETLVGVSKVFWGVAESNHLVDIINQTDYLERFDGEDKLGQPMVSVSRSFEQSTLTALVLPGFREREFLSRDNPLSLPFEVNNDPVYESGDGDDNIDYALRYSGYQGIVDYGLSWFHGTSRDPDYIPGTDGRLIPFYPQIDQFGLDLQVTSDAWLWKLEVIRRLFNDSNTISGEDFTALVGGFEYSFYGMAEGLYDLGLLLEYHMDSREDPGSVVFQNDIFAATRFGFTDAASSEILVGFIVDLDDQTSSFRVEANRRIFSDFRISLEAQAFSNVDPGNVGFGLRHSDFVRLSLEMFF